MSRTRSWKAERISWKGESKGRSLHHKFSGSVTAMYPPALFGRAQSGRAMALSLSGRAGRERKG